MPGTPAEYMSDPSTQEAEAVIDQMIGEGAGGAAIIDALETAGLRVYNMEEIEEIPQEDEYAEDALSQTPEEMPDEDFGEYEGGPMLDSEKSALSPGPSMAGGDEGGNRGMIIEAVRFGLDKDKEKKSKSRKSE